MILKASQRGGAGQLAVHLLKAENEHVEVHELSGFMASDLKAAFKEMQAIARGTRCKQFLFSVSLNPPESASVPVDAFERALERIEEQTGLTGQPRVVVFHEKEGRRHAHAALFQFRSHIAPLLTGETLPGEFVLLRRPFLAFALKLDPFHAVAIKLDVLVVLLGLSLFTRHSVDRTRIEREIAIAVEKRQERRVEMFEARR